MNSFTNSGDVYRRTDKPLSHRLRPAEQHPAVNYYIIFISLSNLTIVYKIYSILIHEIKIDRKQINYKVKCKIETCKFIDEKMSNICKNYKQLC